MIACLNQISNLESWKAGFTKAYIGCLSGLKCFLNGSPAINTNFPHNIVIIMWRKE